MEYLYTENDLELISWEKIDEFIEKIYKDIKEFIEKNNLKIKYICPILRGGGVPAIKLSHMLDVVDMLPIQLKYDSTTQKRNIKLGLEYVKDTLINDDECILLVEGNHCTGGTSNIAVDMLREKFGENIKIIYAALTKDYTYKDSVKNTCFTTCGRYSNESRELSEEECKKLGISYNLVSVYPWENVEEELRELNGY